MSDMEDVYRYVDREIRHLREIHEQRFDAMDRALELQAREYERRLEALKDKLTSTRERMIYAAGAIAAIVVIVSWLVQWIIRGLT